MLNKEKVNCLVEETIKEFKELFEDTIEELLAEDIINEDILRELNYNIVSYIKQRQFLERQYDKLND